MPTRPATITSTRPPTAADTSLSSSSSIIPQPPSYPPDAFIQPPPSYNVRPAANEDSLLSGAIPPPEGIYTKRCKYFLVALTGQESSLEVGEEDDPCRRPLYGKGVTVAGVIELQQGSGFKPSDVLKISLKVQGKVKVDIAEGGNTSQLILDHSTLLFPSSTATVGPCPSMLAFSYALPAVFSEDSPSDGLVQRQLPPTYLYQHDGLPPLRAEVKYSIKIQIERKVLWNIKKKHTARIIFNYVPRTRPHAPGPSPDASFVAALKQTPEEWAAFINDVPRRMEPTTREVHVQDTQLPEGATVTSALVLPSTQTFPIGQAIPVHLQLAVYAPPSPRSSLPLPPAPTTPSFGTPLRRPKTALTPSCATSFDLGGSMLSLFADPLFGPPPLLGRRRGDTAVIGLAEGMAADGAMFGDPRYANTGRGTSIIPNDREPRPSTRKKPSRPKTAPTRLQKQEEEERKRSRIRVFLQRQIVVMVNGQKVVKTIAVGDGTMHQVRLDSPPAFTDLPLNFEDSDPSLHRRGAVPSEQEGVNYIAWEGQVFPKRQALTVGGFRTNILWVKDFITLTMVPPDPEHAPLRALHHAVPIRLVSDPWEEEWWSGRRA